MCHAWLYSHTKCREIGGWSWYFVTYIIWRGCVMHTVSLQRKMKNQHSETKYNMTAHWLIMHSGWNDGMHIHLNDWSPFACAKYAPSHCRNRCGKIVKWALDKRYIKIQPKLCRYISPCLCLSFRCDHMIHCRKTSKCVWKLATILFRIECVVNYIRKHKK